MNVALAVLKERRAKKKAGPRVTSFAGGSNLQPARKVQPPRATLVRLFGLHVALRVEADVDRHPVLLGFAVPHAGAVLGQARDVGVAARFDLVLGLAFRRDRGRSGIRAPLSRLAGGVSARLSRAGRGLAGLVR